MLRIEAEREKPGASRYETAVLLDCDHIQETQDFPSVESREDASIS